MKVLYVNTDFAKGGAARAARRIMQGVSQQGVECETLVKNIGAKPDDEVVHALVDFQPQSRVYKAFDWCAHKVKNKCQHLRWRRYRKQSGDIYLSDLRSTASFGALQKLQYDVLHLHWINGRFLNIDALAKVKKPIVWTLHDCWPYCGVCHYFAECDRYKTHCGKCPVLWENPDKAKERDLAYRVFERKRKAFADLDLHIVTPSRWMGDCAKESALLGRFPVTVIPNCIDVDKFKPIPLEEAAQRWLPNETQKKTYILYGAMNATTDKRKGFDNLLMALKEYQSQHDCSSLELIVFGVMSKIKRLQLDFPIRYIGRVNNDDDMAKLYSVADVMVVPSLTENLSNVIMESLACGTPVVAFNIGGNGDMIDHQSNGFLAQDESEMAEGIAWCLEHNHDGHLSHNARQKVLDNFTPEKVSRQYASLYQSIAK